MLKNAHVYYLFQRSMCIECACASFGVTVQGCMCVYQMDFKGLYKYVIGASIQGLVCDVSVQGYVYV